MGGVGREDGLRINDGTVDGILGCTVVVGITEVNV